MALIDGLRSILTSESGEDTTTYRCLDCLAEYDVRQRLCPKCGGERVDAA